MPNSLHSINALAYSSMSSNPESSPDVYDFNAERKSTIDAQQKEWSSTALLANTAAFIGIQFTWTVELAYGSPYLLALGLPKSWMALVWLAGPLSGLLVQPIVGVLSDTSTHPWGRRRPFIAASTVLVLVAVFLVGFSPNLGTFLFRTETAQRYFTVASSVFAFYLLDFSINAVQACCRSLIMDIANRYDAQEGFERRPVSAGEAANTWAGRMIGVGNVLGYFMGFIDLTLFFSVGSDGTQLQSLCVLSMLVLSITVIVTCVTCKEEPLSPSQVPGSTARNHTISSGLAQIWRAFGSLPSNVQKLCNVQFFAWMGWFPFLFYSTSWVTELDISTREYPNSKDEYCMDPKWSHSNLVTHGTQAGSFALLCYSIMALFAGVVLPWTAEQLRQPRLYARIGQYSNHASILQKWSSLPRIFTLSLVLFAVLNLLIAPFVQSVAGATLLILLVGICWAVAMWVPFSLIGVYMEMEVQAQGAEHDTPSTIMSNGTVFGIHNIYAVIPQLIVNFSSSVIFSLSGESIGSSADKECQLPDPFVQNALDEAKSFSHLFQLGGLATVVAAVLSFRLAGTSLDSSQNKSNLSLEDSNF